MRVAIPIALCMAVAVLEGFDIQAMGVAAPRLAPEFGLGPGEMKWVFAVSNIGMVIGAAFGGWLADRVGRKPVFMTSVAMFGVFTLCVIFTREFGTLFAARLLAGLGFGAALPNMMAIATELSSPARRASTAALIFCGLPIGGGTVALLTQVLPPDLDWRVLFIVGGLLPALLVPALYWLLPETLSFSARQLPKERAPVLQSAVPRRTRGADVAALARVPADAAHSLSDSQLAADAGRGQRTRSRHRAAGLARVQLGERRRRAAVRLARRPLWAALAADAVVRALSSRRWWRSELRPTTR